MRNSKPTAALHGERPDVRIERLNRLKEDLLAPGALEAKLRRITDSVVQTVAADFARIWVVGPGDLCAAGCFHATVERGPHFCRRRDSCLHLVASSGRYTHIDGAVHRRVPFGCYKIGQVAAAEEAKFVTTDVTGDPRVHDPEWARALGLVSFAGYRLLSAQKEPIGVLALFSRRPISSDDDALLETVATTTSQVIQTALAQEALRESEELLRTVVNATRDAMIAIGDDRCISLFNPAAEQMFGRKGHDMLGRPLDVLMPEEYRRRHVEYVSRYFATGESTGALKAGILELPGLRRDGTVFPMLVSLAAGMRNGRRFVVAVLRDVTEQKRAEEALRRSSEQLAALAEEQKFILDNMRDFVYRHDAEGIFFYLSPAVEHLTGYTVAEWKKHYTAYLTDNPINEKVVKNTERTLQTGECNPPYQVEIRHKNGSPVMLEVSERPYYHDGRVAGIVGVARDITERTRAEEQRRALEAQMQHAQKLESLGVLAGGIAHDFNNLLVGILGNASLALDRLSPESPARGAIEQVEHAAQRAAELTRQMLAYSGKGAFVIEPVNLSRLVEEIAHLLEAVTSKKALLQYDFPEHLPLIEADATQVRQVVMNLITNASEAIGGKSGIIVVRTGVMEADREYLAESWPDKGLPAGNYVYVEVADTGCGMDVQTQARLFDPFFTTKFTGRGLGLASVLGIVRGHRGAIKIRSQPGRGSTFRVLFPALAAVVEAAPDEPVHPLDSGATGVILVADDEEVVRTTAKLALEDKGFTVMTASDGREALNVFREHSGEIDAVLLDLTMPHMNGEEVLQELRRLRSDVRVILSSGYSEQEAMARMGGMTSARFLQKPYRLATLTEILREIIRPA